MPSIAPFTVRVLAAAGLILSEASAWAQCAMCRTALATPDGQRLAGALRSGIVILLIATAAAFGVIAFAAIRSRRRTELNTCLKSSWVDPGGSRSAWGKSLAVRPVGSSVPQ